MPFDAKEVANYFLSVAGLGTLTQMKLQKLVYFAHGWNLGLTEAPLIDEEVQAWSFGPVIFSLYKEFTEFGSNPINRLASTIVTHNEDGYPLNFVVERSSFVNDASEQQFLDRIWEIYGKYSPIQLSNLTHAEGTPWHTVYQKHGGRLPKYAIIPQDLIRDYFAKKASE